MTEESLLSVEFIYCRCQCGFTKPLRDNWGRKSKYIIGHSRKGKKHSEETKQKIGLANQGEKNKHWKADDVGYDALHKWVRKHFWPTRLCQMCMEVPPYDLTNITGVYKRDFRNWRYYCRRCHCISDKRMFNFIEKGKLTRFKKKVSLDL